MTRKVVKEMLLSEALGIEPQEVVTVVGAGGKSSLLLSLAREWKENKRPFILTTTTKMFVEQVENTAPVVSPAYEEGAERLLETLASRGYASWFTGFSGEKALGVEAGWIDRFYKDYRDRITNIILEGDGARGRLLKIPGPREPVVPESCHRLIGVMNLRAIGRELSADTVHRYELAVPFLGRKEGLIEAGDLAALALHPDGIFKNARKARKVVVLSGAAENNMEQAAQLAQAILGSNRFFSACVATAGFKEGMKPLAVFKS